ncbi:hypothetical protein LWI28_027949 [Acer negundo]|uniref:Uncharacterized protein n=1 Tax=Acer negundo TaxID=4023 RepID=A0AAD5JB95_ACENE|nr:hypothetical protein LWI28_027949 [Acer negundo]
MFLVSKEFYKNQEKTFDRAMKEIKEILLQSYLAFDAKLKKDMESRVREEEDPMKDISGDFTEEPFSEDEPTTFSFEDERFAEDDALEFNAPLLDSSCSDFGVFVLHFRSFVLQFWSLCAPLSESLCSAFGVLCSNFGVFVLYFQSLYAPVSESLCSIFGIFVLQFRSLFVPPLKSLCSAFGVFVLCFRSFVLQFWSLCSPHSESLCSSFGVL